MVLALQWIALWVAMSLATAALAAPTATAPCLGQMVESVAPIGKGPVSLDRIYCVAGFSPRPASAGPVPSPDWRHFFVYDSRDERLEIGSLINPSRTHHFPADLTIRHEFRLPAVWANDGQAVFTVVQNKQKPRGGWALGPIKPYSARTNGSQRSFPALPSQAGLLDGIHWIGNAGKALVLLGSKGGFYRPEHADPNPTIAIADVARGRIIQSVAHAELTHDPSRIAFDRVASRLDGDGRAEIVFRLAGRWMSWREREEPRALPLSVSVPDREFAMTPDGRALLIMQGLTATGVICEFNPACPPSNPAKGPIAVLHDLRTGKRIWTLEGIARNFSRDGLPVVSDDSRYALITVPFVYGQNRVALVDMKTGRVLQEIYAPNETTLRMGFNKGSRSLWISGNLHIALYRIAR